MSIHVKYGIDNSVTKPSSEYPSVSSVINDCDLQAVLGFSGENVEAVVNGVAQTAEALLRDGDIVELRTVAARKG